MTGVECFPIAEHGSPLAVARAYAGWVLEHQDHRVVSTACVDNVLVVTYETPTPIGSAPPLTVPAPKPRKPAVP